MRSERMVGALSALPPQPEFFLILMWLEPEQSTPLAVIALTAYLLPDQDAGKHRA